MYTQAGNFLNLQRFLFAYTKKYFPGINLPANHGDKVSRRGAAVKPRKPANIHA